MRRAIPLLLLLAGCGGSPRPNPSTPTPPTPTPSPTAVVGCGLVGPGPGNGLDCPRIAPAYVERMEAATDKVIAQHPEYFDLGDSIGPGAYKVLRPAPYVIALIRELEAGGLCAGSDLQEIQVKLTNDFNEQYQVILSSGYLRRGQGSYRATCAPACFPTAWSPIPPPEGCTLPPSRELTCSRLGEEPAFLDDVEAAIEGLRGERPDLFDGDRVLDFDAYHAGVVRRLNRDGRCARFDGEEVVVKSTNEYSEQHKILLSSGRVRTGEGVFRARCYPAAF